MNAPIRMNPHLSELGIARELIAARGLRAHEEAASLVSAEVSADGRNHLLVPAAAHAWRSLKQAALAEGVNLYVVSAFRSVARQAELVRQKLETGEAIADILTVCAPPGYSEHHTGRAVDISTPDCRALEVAFDQTAACAWLKKHAGRFGYAMSYPMGNPWGFQYEPWHWCFRE